MITLNIKFKINNQIFGAVTPANYQSIIVADSQNYLKFLFEFSAEWTGLIYAQFYRFAATKKTEAITKFASWDEEEKVHSVMVPAEVIKSPEFSFSLHSVDNPQLVTAERKKINVKLSGFSDFGVPPEEPQEGWLPVITPWGDTKLPFMRLENGILQGSFDGETWFDAASVVTGTGSGGTGKIYVTGF